MKTKKQDVIDGYIAAAEKAPDIFPATRTITAHAYSFQGVYYFKTRELADLLGMKQPFKFTMMCRKYLGPGAILSGNETKDFRSKNDSARETFISAYDLYQYLLSDKTSSMQSYAAGMYDRVLEVLPLYM